MAGRSVFKMGFLFATSLLLLLSSVVHAGGQSSEEDEVLMHVNEYRTQIVGIEALEVNEKAACVGREIAKKFDGTDCTNQTGANTQYENTPQFTDFPNLLSNCKVDLVNVSEGFIAVDCIPSTVSSSDASSVAARNITSAPKYQENINSTSFTSGGVGSSGIWYALVLATNSSNGDYGMGSSGADREQRMGIQVVLLFALLAAFGAFVKW